LIFGNACQDVGIVQKRTSEDATRLESSGGRFTAMMAWWLSRRGGGSGRSNAVVRTVISAAAIVIVVAFILFPIRRGDSSRLHVRWQAVADMAFSADGSKLAVVYESYDSAFRPIWSPGDTPLLHHLLLKLVRAERHFLIIWDTETGSPIYNLQRKPSTTYPACTWVTTRTLVLSDPPHFFVLGEGASLKSYWMPRSAVLSLFPTSGVSTEFGYVDYEGVVARANIGRTDVSELTSLSLCFGSSSHVLPVSGSHLAVFCKDGRLALVDGNLAVLAEWSFSSAIDGFAHVAEDEILFLSAGDVFVLELASEAPRALALTPGRRYTLAAAAPGRGRFALGFMDSSGEAGVEVFSYPECNSLSTTETAVVQLAYSPDGRTLAGAVRDGDVNLWRGD
jgi:WD40 repeat protein